MAYLQFEAIGLPRVATELSVSYVDHNTLQMGFRNPDDHAYLRTVAAKYGIIFSPPGTGICHQLHLENFACPGKTLIGSDSHTPTAGGLGVLAMAPVLAQTAFEATEPGWFKKAFNLSHSSVLAGLEKRIPADPALWDKEKDRWMATLAQSKQSELFKSYLQTVQQEAKVEMVNESVLGPKPGAAGKAGADEKGGAEKP